MGRVKFGPSEGLPLAVLGFPASKVTEGWVENPPTLTPAHGSPGGFSLPLKELVTEKATLHIAQFHNGLRVLQPGASGAPPRDERHGLRHGIRPTPLLADPRRGFPLSKNVSVTSCPFGGGGCSESFRGEMARNQWMRTAPKKQKTFPAPAVPCGHRGCLLADRGWERPEPNTSSSPPPKKTRSVTLQGVSNTTGNRSWSGGTGAAAPLRGATAAAGVGARRGGAAEEREERRRQPAQEGGGGRAAQGLAAGGDGGGDRRLGTHWGGGVLWGRGETSKPQSP